MQVLRRGFFKVPSWPVLAKFVRVQVFRPFSTELLHWQWVSVLACLLVCINPWIFPSRWLSWIRLRFHGYAQNRSRAVWTCVLFPMMIRVALLPAVPVKPPSVHDEFSSLLMGDTFRSGRLTNPTHPFWMHFETINVIQKPTYNSMYPPGYGVFPAIGYLLHNPWIGILLSVGLMCGAICWMLQGWMPPAWALCGALVAALQIGIAGYWMNSYMGVPFPAMAGALLLGAMPRFLRTPAWSTAAIFAIGVVILMNTRPFEGLFFSILCFGFTIFWRWKGAVRKPVIQWPILAPAVLILMLSAVFTVYYSWRVTGNPLKMPYVVNRETYGFPENLAFLPPQQVTYRHQIMRSMHLSQLANRARYTTFGRMLDSWGSRAFILWEFYVGPGLTLPLLMLPWTIRSGKIRKAFYVGLCIAVLNTSQLVGFPQYLSPVTAIFYLLIAGGMRQIYVLAHRKRMLPERWMAAVVLCVACCAGLKLFGESLHFDLTFWEQPYFPQRDKRAAILYKLERMPGKHLMFVHYEDYHSPHEEWVYNAADIDKSKIVWTNSMDPKSDMALREYFRDRQAWVVEPDRDANGFLPVTHKTYDTLGFIAVPASRSN
ncbi:MAG: hypothetical protein ACR2NN_14380 [Bryobacteraceae bacterium]